MNFLEGFMVGDSDIRTLNEIPNQPKDHIGAFTSCVCTSVAFANDLKHIHLHASGEDFDKTHNLAQELYDKTGDESDYLAELAMEHNEQVPNFSQAATIVGWQAEEKEKYNYSEALLSIMSGLTQYISALKYLRESVIADTDVQSKLDDMIRDWNVELQYKLTKRAE